MANRESIESGISVHISIEGEKTYWVRMKDRRGNWYPRASFKRLVDARSYKAKLLNDRERGQSATKAQDARISYADYWEIWKAECRQDVSEGWQGDQERMERVYIREHLNGLKIADIRPQDIGRVIAATSAMGRSAQTVTHVYNLLHKMFDDAIDHFEILDRSPVLKRYRPRIPRVERDFLRPDEVGRLMGVSIDHFLQPAVWIACLAGLRPSEVQALRWEAVSFDPPQILIKAAYKRKIRRIEPFPKQKDWGLVPIAPQLAEYLKRLSQGKSPTDFVAPGEGGGMLNYNVFLLALTALCAEAGLKRVTPHELRHSCTELWVQAGANREDISRILNQSSQKVVERYMHRTNDRTTALAGKVNVGGLNDSPSAPKAPPILRVIR